MASVWSARYIKGDKALHYTHCSVEPCTWSTLWEWGFECLKLETIAVLWNCSCICVLLPFRKAHIQSNGKRLQIPERVVKKSTEKVSNPTAAASWSGWSSAMTWAERMDLLCWETLVLILQGDLWAHDRGARETNLMLSEEGRVWGVFLSASLPSRATYTPALCPASGHIELMSLWYWGCHGQQLVQLSVTLSLFCAASLPTNGTDTTTWENTSEIALRERTWTSSDGRAPVLLVGVIFVKQQQQRTIQCLFSDRAFVSSSSHVGVFSARWKEIFISYEAIQVFESSLHCIGCCISLSSIPTAVASWQFEMGWAFFWISQRPFFVSEIS